MPIVITLDVVLAKRKMRSRALAAKVGMREQHLSEFKCGRIKGIRFETLERLCDALDCQPGDLLAFRPARPAAGSERNLGEEAFATAPGLAASAPLID